MQELELLCGHVPRRDQLLTRRLELCATLVIFGLRNDPLLEKRWSGAKKPRVLYPQ